MKKVMTCFGICMTLIVSGCSSKTKETTCKIKNDKTNNSKVEINIEYSDDELSGIEIHTTTTTGDDVLKTAKERKNFEEDLKLTQKSLEEDGVEAELSLDKKGKSVSQIITVSLSDLSEESYARYSIPSDKKVFKYIKALESNGYTCDAIDE